jgi:hypothetical protein
MNVASSLRLEQIGAQRRHYNSVEKFENLFDISDLCHLALSQLSHAGAKNIFNRRQSL